MKLKWFQLTYALPREWNQATSTYDGSLQNLLMQDDHLVKKNQVVRLTKLNSNELSKIQIIIKSKKTTSQWYFEMIFRNSNLEWKTIYLLPRIGTVNMTICIFQYKLLSNVLFLSKIQYWFGISQDELYSLCCLEEETLMHIYFSCNHMQILWGRLKYDIKKQFRNSISNITECHIWLYWLSLQKLHYYKTNF